MAIPEKYNADNARDLASLKAALTKLRTEILRENPTSLSPALDRELRVLDLACGDCREGEVLSDFAASLVTDEEASVSLTGMDIRAREIADAARRFGKSGTPKQGRGPRNYDFLNGDATKLLDHKELGEAFDIVFLRHQNYWNGARDWEEIFHHALSKLHPEGHLIITSYFDREHALALDAIERQGGELMRSDFNPLTRSLTTPGKSVDRRIAIFRRAK